MEKPTAFSPGRLEFLDLVRGVFLLIMIEGHTLRAARSGRQSNGRLSVP